MAERKKIQVGSRLFQQVVGLQRDRKAFDDDPDVERKKKLARWQSHGAMKSKAAGDEERLHAPAWTPPTAACSLSAAFASRPHNELVARYDDDGFLLLPELMTAAAAAEAAAACATLLAERCAQVPAQWLLGLHQPAQPRPQPWVAALALDRALGRLMAALLGAPRVALLSTQLFAKLPGDAAVPWHQDGPQGGGAASGGSLTLWVALSDIRADGANGGLAVLPRLHKQGALPMVDADGSTAQFERAIAPAALAAHLDRAVGYALRPGDAGLHGPWTPHASAANASDAPRLALVLKYEDAAALEARGEQLWSLDPRTGAEAPAELAGAGPTGAGAAGVGPVPGGEAAAPPRARGSRCSYLCWSSGELMDRRVYLLPE